jgi:hypothetical protein
LIPATEHIQAFINRVQASLSNFLFEQRAPASTWIAIKVHAAHSLRKVELPHYDVYHLELVLMRNVDSYPGPR